MNETLKTISKRYSCRNFKEEMPSNDDLLAIANAAVQSPSALNLQGWRVIVVKNRELIKEIESEGMKIIENFEDKTAYNRIMSRGGKLFYNAPSMIIVPIDTKNGEYSLVDCGIVCENIALASTSLGLGSVICAMAGLPFKGEKSLEFKSKLGFPKGFEFGLAVLIGYENSVGNPHEPDKSKISFIE